VNPTAAAFLALVKPIIDRVAKAIHGETSTAAAYALLSLAVVEWQKAGLPDANLFELVQRLAQKKHEIEAERPPGSGGLN
jgi:hypothetical protein